MSDEDSVEERRRRSEDCRRRRGPRAASVPRPRRRWRGRRRWRHWPCYCDCSSLSPHAGSPSTTTHTRTRTSWWCPTSCSKDATSWRYSDSRRPTAANSAPGVSRPTSTPTYRCSSSRRSIVAHCLLHIFGRPLCLHCLEFSPKSSDFEVQLEIWECFQKLWDFYCLRKKRILRGFEIYICEFATIKSALLSVFYHWSDWTCFSCLHHSHLSFVLRIRYIAIRVKNFDMSA